MESIAIDAMLFGDLSGLAGQAGDVFKGKCATPAASLLPSRIQSAPRKEAQFLPYRPPEFERRGERGD